MQCDVVIKCYDLYFGSCDHIGTRWYLRCSFHVIMFGGPLGDALSLGDLCSVYKAGCCRSSDLGKKQVSFRHKRTKATQQDLSNHILEHRSNGIGVKKKKCSTFIVYIGVHYHILSMAIF